MTPMARFRETIAAAVLAGTLWAQDAAPPNPSAPTTPSNAATSPGNEALAGPVATKMVRPIYPFAAVKDKLQGKVLVRVVISETGDVESANAISGDPILAATAVDTAKQWKFKPYLKDGSPAKIAMNLSFAFICVESVSKAAPPLVTNPDSFWRDVPRTMITVRLLGKPGEQVASNKTEPDYPLIAKTALIQGTVVLFAVIGKDGAVRDVRVIRGHPLLTQASIDAVRQWRFKPLLLDDQPIEVQAVVEVHYTLSPFPL